MPLANELELLNLAISETGSSKQLTSTDGTIANLVETTDVDGVTAKLRYERTRLKLLEMFPWNFARKHVLLTEVSVSSPVWEDEWAYAYEYPADAATIRRFLRDGSRLTLTSPNALWFGRMVPLGTYSRGWEWQRAHHNGAQVILTNVAPTAAKVEYTFDNTDVTEWPDHFVDCMTLALASHMLKVRSIDEGVVQAKQNEAVQAYVAAAANAANEANDRAATDGDIAMSRWSHG